MSDSSGGPILLINAGARLAADPPRAFLDIPDPVAFFRERAINTGDLLVTDSLRRQLGPVEVLPFPLDAPPDPSAWGTERPRAAVLRGSNYISHDADWGHWLPLLRALPGPVVAVGLGAQAPTAQRFAIPAGTQEVLRVIADKSESVGVRGAFTAELLHGIGIRNVRVVGCPSFFRSCRPSISVARPDADGARVGITLNRGLSGIYASNGSRAMRVQRELLRQAARRPGSRVYAQGEREEALAVLAPDPETREAALRDVLRGHRLPPEASEAEAALLRATLHTFLDPEPWIAHVREHVDAVMGFRFHGNMIALTQGLPAVFFTYDSRTRELTDLFSVPAVDADGFEPPDISALLRAADWSGFEAAYRSNYAAYRDFLEENGLPHALPPPEAAEAAPGPRAAQAVRADVTDAASAAWYRREALEMSNELREAWHTVGRLRAQLQELRPGS